MKKLIKKKKILIAEDDPNMVHTLRLLLKQKGYSVFHASNGAEVIKRTKELIPDLLLLDIIMPGFDGMTALMEIKKNPKVKNIPVIVITAILDKHEESLARMLGVFAFVKKPFKPQDLVSKIDEVLGRK